MKETSKAMERRAQDKAFPWQDIFRGNILDVGSGDDGLKVEGCEVRLFDLPDGSGDDIRDFFPVGTQFDVIHGSQVLEHMGNPVRALYSWIDMVREGGHIIATVPDFELYEHLTFPSKWNAGHRSTWSLESSRDWEGLVAPIHCWLPSWLQEFPVEILRCQLVDTNYDHALLNVDQTLDPEKGVEAFIEMVLRKPML